jgi:uncharacterized Zn finger protein
VTDPWWLDEAPARPIKVTGGIQINSARGAVARTWWSKRFLAVLEQIGVGGRMARGRAYARQGQIISLEVDAGSALAKVQGSRPKPYTVRVGVPAFGKAEWGEVAEVLVADASYTAALLAGEMPHGIEEVFAAVGLSLFPGSARDLALDCTCPDQAVPCKHLAAVCYVLAERFDADPFEILALRGRDRDTLLAELRSRRAAAASARSRGVPLAEVLDAFYIVASPLPAPVAGPDSPPDALLDQIPPFPVALRGEPVTELLRPLYQGLGGA